MAQAAPATNASPAPVTSATATAKSPVGQVDRRRCAAYPLHVSRVDARRGALGQEIVAIHVVTQSGEEGGAAAESGQVGGEVEPHPARAAPQGLRVGGARDQ